MANTPAVTVGAPDDVGLRKVTIDGKSVGRVRCPGELQRVLRHFGLVSGYDIIWIGGDSTVWPDHSWWRRAIGTFTAAGLLAAAYVLFRIGIPDSFDSLTYAGRIAGAIFLLLGLVELLAATATLDYWRKRRMKYSGVIILFGTLVALGVSSVLLLVQEIGWVYTPYLLLWVALWGWSVCALWVLIRSRAWKGMRNPRRIAIGAVVSTLFTLANLGYSQVYIPYTTSPLVQTGAEFGPPSLSREEKKMYLTVHLYVKNSGQISVYVLGSIYWIHVRPEGVAQDDNSKLKLIKSREFVTPPGRVLNPGQEFAQDVVVEIPNPVKSKYAAVRAESEVYVIRKDRVTMDASDYERSGRFAGRLREEHKDKEPQGPDEAYYRYQSEISNSDEILNMTRGRQRVTLWWVFHGNWPYICADVGPPGERKAADPHQRTAANQKALERYGLDQVRGSLAMTPFVELLEQAQAAERSAR